MCFYFWIHHQSKNGVAVHIQGIFQWGFMVNPTDRGVFFCALLLRLCLNNRLHFSGELASFH